MKPCNQCPWRLENQGKRHSHSFYTKKNLTRLWNLLRRGGAPQSCHMTDPSHPDHLAVGCKETAEARECPGSVILVLREVRQMADENNVVKAKRIEEYRRSRKRGLTQAGLAYWLLARIQLGGVPLIGGPKLPDVEEDDAVGLPVYLRG
jgi:hypothetical protein